MLPEDVLAQIQAISSLTQRDIDDIRAVTQDDERQVLLQAYVDQSKVPDYGVLEEIGRILQTVEPYISLGESIVAIALRLAGVGIL
jgi:hypothetical protein